MISGFSSRGLGLAHCYLIFFAFSVCLAATTLAQSAKDLLVSGRVDEAISSLQQQTTKPLSPASEAEDHNLICRAYFMVEEWDRGISECERAIAIAPVNSFYHLWLGRVYGEKADHTSFLSAAGLAKKVRSEFERAVELSPQNWEARTDLAEFYIEAPGMVGGGKDKARAQIEALNSLDPAIAHYLSGRLAEKSKNLSLAEQEYRAAIDASQGGAHAWLNLALFFRHLNRLDEMEQALRTMEFRPLDRPESLMDGGAILLRTNRDSKLGVALIREYLSAPTVEQGPAFKAHYLLGQLLEKQGDRPAAADQYRAALAMAREYKKADEALKHLNR